MKIYSLAYLRIWIDQFAMIKYKTLFMYILNIIALTGDKISIVITESISKTKFVITIEDGTQIGGLGSSIKELIVNKNIEGVKIKCFAYPDEFIKHGSVPELEKNYGLDCENIFKYVKNSFGK